MNIPSEMLAYIGGYILALQAFRLIEAWREKRMKKHARNINPEIFKTYGNSKKPHDKNDEDEK